MRYYSNSMLYIKFKVNLGTEGFALCMHAHPGFLSLLLLVPFKVSVKIVILFFSPTFSARVLNLTEVSTSCVSLIEFLKHVKN